MDHIQHLDQQIGSTAGAATERDGPSFAAFAKRIGVIVGGGSLLVMLLVATVDPYRLFGFVDASGFNQVKPLPEQYREQIKLAQAIAAKPNALLIGNSRIEVGFDPDSPHLRSHGYSAYNLALAGTQLTVGQKMFAHVRSQAAPPTFAVIGVEFLDFLVSPSPAAAALAAAHRQDTAPALKWRFDTLFSMKALSDSWRTLRLQKNSDPETMTGRGQTPLHEYRRYARQEGYYSIFRQRAQENAKNIGRKPHSLRGPNGSSPSIDALRGMLATMAQDGTKTHLVIYPYHAQFMAMFEEAGLQPTMEEWKSLLVREVEAVRRQHPRADITLWDFSGYGPVQCEPIPAPGDRRSVTRFYWESGHFKSSVGDQILQRITGQQAPIGVALSAANLDQNQQRIAAERAACEREHPAVFADARAMVGAVKAPPALTHHRALPRA